MFEDSVAAMIPSIWASMNSWFTPAVLFVLLNVMIGTIAFTSTLANQNKHHHHHQEHSQNNHQQQQQQQNNNNNNKFTRSPSLLQRVRSINFYSYRPQESNLVTTNASTNTYTTAHIKLSPDSNTLFNLDHTHESQTLDNPTHYIFEQPHQENQTNDDIHMQFNLFQENHQENQPNIDAHMQYNAFQQNHQENGQEINNQFFFEQTHEAKAEEIDTHFDFEHENGAKFEKDEEEEDEDGDELQSLDEVYTKLKGGHVTRTKSDTEPASGEVPVKLPTKMRKSASSKSAFGHFKVEDIVESRRPATVRERGVAKVTEADDGVDAKADDFINKFKQQLKLQRIDSIIRYKDMITRGSGK